VSDKDDFMSEIIHRAILDNDSFATSTVFLLADQFATERVTVSKWVSLLALAYAKDVIYHEGYGTAEEMGMLDLVATAERDAACDGLVTPFLYYKGFKALQAHRIAHVLWNQGRKEAAQAIQSRCSDLFGVDIHPGAIIGRLNERRYFFFLYIDLIIIVTHIKSNISPGAGLMIDHGSGIVIGESATVGTNCSFLHGVTLGSTGKERGDRHPKVGNDVLIGCNATILGNIRIGNCCKIGSGSLVLKALPDGVTAVGNPAKIVGRSTGPAGASMDTAMEHVFNSKGLKFSDTYSLWPDGEVDMFYI
jgi:serine O-acetyltransferase